MSGVSARGRARSAEIVRQDWRATDTSVGDALADDVLTEIAKRTLWKENTAPQLAAACGCSVRQAERILGGHCEWSGPAIAAVVAEIMRRHGMRNLKVSPRQ